MLLAGRSFRCDGHPGNRLSCVSLASLVVPRLLPNAGQARANLSGHPAAVRQPGLRPSVSSSRAPVQGPRRPHHGEAHSHRKARWRPNHLILCGRYPCWDAKSRRDRLERVLTHQQAAVLAVASEVPPFSRLAFRQRQRPTHVKVGHLSASLAPDLRDPAPTSAPTELR